MEVNVGSSEADGLADLRDRLTAVVDERLEGLRARLCPGCRSGDGCYAEVESDCSRVELAELVEVRRGLVRGDPIKLNVTQLEE